MSVLFYQVSQFKSSLYEIARGLLRSRNRLSERNQEQACQIKRLNGENDQLLRRVQYCEQRRIETQQENKMLQRENERLSQQPIQLPSDLPLPHHCFGPKMISLCLNLCKAIGFRPTEAALKIIFEWLGIETKIPSWSSIRNWACRVGVASLQQLPEQADDWIWMADHSNQIGTEKVLQILGIRAGDLPEYGQTLRREKMTVLAVIPGKDWKCDNVRSEYKKLAERMGAPRHLITDGATELIESADTLQNKGEKTIVLRDMKHFAANVLEKLIGKNERFTSYLSEIGRTRSRIQQTELSHFTPPPQKQKARFMNLGPTLRWGQMISYHLSHAHSQSRRGVTANRMNEKLGWVRGYRDDLAIWNRCQSVMQASLKFINHHGLCEGSADQLQTILDELFNSWSSSCQQSQEMATSLIDFVRDSESKLEPDQRVWLSTENLESSFGLFKELEGQHSKGGFTSLIAAMPMLLTNWTAERVRESLSAVSVKAMRSWVAENLDTTLNSKRVTAYKEFKTTPAPSG